MNELEKNKALSQSVNNKFESLKSMILDLDHKESVKPKVKHVTFKAEEEEKSLDDW